MARLLYSGAHAGAPEDPVEALARGWAAAWAAASAAGLLLACPAAERDDAILSGESLYSQGKEELVARHFFRDRRDGFFVDVGAWHWRKFSTTWYLEEQRGWSGIAIDAQK